jgi:hypothetical protein
VTPDELRASRPFLWLSVMSVASTSARTRNRLGRQTRNIIVQRVVGGSERSFDLLLGILTFVNWYDRRQHLF